MCLCTLALNNDFTQALDIPKAMIIKDGISNDEINMLCEAMEALKVLYHRRGCINLLKCNFKS